MGKKTTFLALVLLGVFLFAGVYISGKENNARRPAITRGADRVCELQRTDTGWEGTWFWYVGSTYNATNLTGVTAMGLLEAFRDIKDIVFLDAAKDAAGFIQEHLGCGATGTQYHTRVTAPDVCFLHRLSDVTGAPSYSQRANIEWTNITATYPTAYDLDALFKSINRRSAWDIAFFLEAAHLSGDTAWADDAAGILANISDTFYYGTDTWWYALNVAGAIRALVGHGYYSLYPGSVHSLLSELISLVNDDNGIGGWVQDTAYAVMAFNTVGGAARRYANDLGRWLARNQAENGGWLEGGDEYPEIDGEAVRALCATLGSNITLDGFEPGHGMNPSWRSTAANKERARPFQID